MKIYQTPQVEVIKQNTEELMQQMNPASLTESTTPVDPSDARSKQGFRLFEDGEDEGCAE